MPQLAIYLFGPPEVWLGDQPVSFPSRKALALTAYLSVTSDPHTRDFLAALLWPESSPSRAKASLRQVIWTLTSIGLTDWLEIDRESVAIVPGYYMDTEIFRDLVNSGQSHEHPPNQVCSECLPRLQEAVKLYRDDFLQGFSLRDSPQFDDWQYFQSERLRQMLNNVLEQLVMYFIAQMEWNNAILYGQRFVANNPLNESAQRMLIEAYSLSGKRSLALRQYHDLKDTLNSELGIEPDRNSKSLYEKILNGYSSTIAIPTTYSMNLYSETKAPQNNLSFPLTNFVGREHETAEITELIQHRRLLTLMGPGGIGKTRLALEIGHRLPGKFTGGIWLVEFSNISDLDYVPQAIASTLGMQEQAGSTVTEMLIQSLKLRPPVLLIFDCCEHVISAVAELATSILSSCPQLKIIVTSREALNVTGETVYHIQGLIVPNGPGTTTSNHLLETESIQLFIDRASLVQPGFQPDEGDIQAIVEICQRLEGMPLAIELAAARFRELDTKHIADHLDKQLIQLNTQYRDVAPRHQTLKATFDWSYKLLRKPEQTLFNQLSVFKGDFSIKAVEAICRSSRSKELMTSLADKSMVLIDKYEEDQVYYRLLDTLRQYGSERITERAEIDALRRRHALYYLALARHSAEKLKGQEQEKWLIRLKIEHDNIRSALQWLLEQGESERALKMASWMWRFWWMHGHYQEGCSWLFKTLRASKNKPTQYRGRAFNGAGVLARSLGNYKDARNYLEESLAIYNQLGDRFGAANALNSLGNLAHAQGDYDWAYEYYRHSLEHRKELGDRRGVAISLNNLGNIVHEQKDFSKAYDLYTESRQIFESIGDQRGIGAVLINLGCLYLDQKDGSAADSLFSESLTILQGLEQREDIIECLEGLAGASSLAHDSIRAYRLMDMASGLRALINAPIPPYNRQRHQAIVDSIMAQIDNPEMEVIQNEDEAFGLNQAIAYALRQDRA